VIPEPFRVGCGVWCYGTRLKSCAWGYPVYSVPTVAPGPTSREAVNPQVGPIPFPYAALMIFILDDFEALVRFHQWARGGI
jgi:hypothetical protein